MAGERAKLSESCVLIGYPSGQDGPTLLTQDCPLCSHNSEILWTGVIFWPYNKSIIDQVCSVKMAGYWPRSFFAFLWTETKSRSIKRLKKNLANICHLDRTSLVNNAYVKPDCFNLCSFPFFIPLQKRIKLDPFLNTIIIFVKLSKI